MGKTAGGVRGTPKVKRPGGGDSSYHGNIKNVRDLVTVKDPAVYKELKQAISRFHSALGVRERQVMIADLSKTVMGVQMTNVLTGKSTGIYLNSRWFDQSKAWIEKDLNRQMKNGWQTKTKKPVQHVALHELGHSLWNSSLGSTAAKSATPAINKLYEAWGRDNKKRGYGKYSKTNIDEFWAETCAKATRGDQDRYTRGVKGIVRKYKL